MKLRSIYKCHGGKFYLTDFIISHFPKNYQELRYIEAAGGAASVLLNKKRSVSEVYNDLDPNIAGIVQELTADDSSEFISAVNQIPYTKEQFEWSLKASENALGMEQSLAELVRRRFSRGGLRKAFSWSERLRGGEPGDAHAWRTFKQNLILIAERLKGVEVYCMPMNELIKKHDAWDVLWYVDPPYLGSTRTAKKAYTYEMTEEEHIELGELLNKAEGRVLLSGYQSPLYCKLYKGWKLTAKPVANHAGQNKVKQQRIECLWRNY
jgi:DNA adenine methylase